MRLQRLVPGLLAILAVAASATVTYFVYHVYAGHPDGNLTSLVACFAAVLALLGWLSQSWIALRNMRKQHSINVLFQSRMNAEYLKIQKLISEAYPGGESLFSPVSKPHSDVDRAILFMLNYYEFIAVGIWHGDLDYSIMRDCIRSQFLSFTRRAQRIISETRGEGTNGVPDRSKALYYKSLLKLREQWQGDFWRATGAWPRR